MPLSTNDFLIAVTPHMTEAHHLFELWSLVPAEAVQKALMPCAVQVAVATYLFVPESVPEFAVERFADGLNDVLAVAVVGQVEAAYTYDWGSSNVVDAPAVCCMVIDVQRNRIVLLVVLVVLAAIPVPMLLALGVFGEPLAF
eukprot:Colp12_sorted_trinity150504_noHs@6371